MRNDVTGKYIARWFSHRIYRRDWENCVRKVPIFPNRLVFTYEDHARYLGLLSQYMDEFLLSTKIVSNDDCAYILEQKYLSTLRNVTAHELASSENLRTQFLNLLSLNDRMYNDTGCSVDLIGHDGVLSSLSTELYRHTPIKLQQSAHLSNLTIIWDVWYERILLLDITLTDQKHSKCLVRFGGRIVNMVCRWWLQRYFWDILPSGYMPIS